MRLQDSSVKTINDMNMTKCENMATDPTTDHVFKEANNDVTTRLQM